MISDFRVYRFYLAIKLHFSKENFNVFEQKGTKCSLEAFHKRNDCQMFEMIGKKFDNHQTLIQFIVANIAIGFDGFLYDRECAFDNYKKWVAYKESASYKFRVDLVTIKNYSEKYKVEFFEASWKCYLNKTINIQSIHVLNEFGDIFKGFGDSTLLLHKDEILRIKKCKGFVKIPETMKGIFNKYKEV